MRLSLLRSSYDPDPAPDVGVHEISYSLYPHSGDWRSGHTPRRAYELNNPLRAIQVNAHRGKLPSARSFLAVEPSNLVVTALKKAEDGMGLILRFYESEGSPVTATIRTTLPVKHWRETNLVERDIGPAHKVVGPIRVRVGKHEIKTLRLVF